MMKKRSVFQVIVATLILLAGYSCQEDEFFDAGPYGYDDASLNMTGKAFLQTVQSTPRWEKEWEAAKRIGTPQPNEVFNVYSPGHGAYTVVPIVREGEVTHVVFYPQEADSEPLIVGSDAEEYPDYVRGFFQARCYTTWEESELKVNRELKLFVYNDSTAQATPMASTFPHVFPADIWVSFDYEYTDTWNNFYQRLYEVQQTLQSNLYRARQVIKNVDFTFPGNTHDVDLRIRDASSYNEANGTAIRFLDYVAYNMYQLTYVTRAWAVYFWNPPANGSGGGRNGSFYKDPSETDESDDGNEEKAVCLKCRRPIENCTCSISFVIQIPQGYNLKLTDEYNIRVYIGGELKNEISTITIEMTKIAYPNGWVRIASGSPNNCQYGVKMLAFNPGDWKIRVGFQVKSSSSIGYSENIKQLTILCPSINEFKNNATVVEFLEGLWDKSVAFARENQATHAVREFGAFILIDQHGNYSCKEVDPGPIVHATEAGAHGSISAKVEGNIDVTEWNNPNRRKPIAVGFMHTHYPSTWVPKNLQREPGPTEQDKLENHMWPGLLFDYTITNHGGDPVEDPNNPLKIWTFGPERCVYE